MTARRLLLVALVVAALPGCADAVDPTLGLDVPFSLYGYLDPTADRQAVRVVPIVDALDVDSLSLDAAVTSTDLGTGEVTAWRDSLVTFDDGSVGHVFVAPITPRPGSTVRLEARRSDGAVSSVEVAVPPIVAPTVTPPESAPGEVFYGVRFEGAPRVQRGQLELAVTDAGGALRLLRVPVEVDLVEALPDVWTVRVPFLSAVDRFMRAEGLRGSGLRLLQATYVGFVTNEAWDPPTDDVDALVEPGTFENVEGGLGFIGAGYPAKVEWVPSPSVQGSLGFEVPGGPAGEVRINEVRTGPDGWVEFYNPLFSPVALGRYGLSDTQADPFRQPFTAGDVVPARGFLVVPLRVEAGLDRALYFSDPGGVQLQRFYVADEQAGRTFGSYPDGRTLRIRETGGDIFQGVLFPTPGAPNALAAVPGALNEIATEGLAGWVEVAVEPGFEAAEIQVIAGDPRRVDRWSGPGTVDEGLPLRVVGETAERLSLPQQPTEVLLYMAYAPPGGPPQARVVDVHTYGPQSAGRSVGRLPDGPGGTWTEGLRPTRGAPNALARLGL